MSRNGKRTWSIRSLAQETKIPAAFLRKIMQKLNRAGMVSSQRGPVGGFSLTRKPGRIKVLEVMEALQGPVAINRCFLERSCPRFNKCELRENLRKPQLELVSVLGKMTLEQLAEGKSGRRNG
jgi:Rrf2 family protein